MNYRLKKVLFLPLSPFHMRGVYGRHNRVQTMGHEKFFSSFNPFFLTFYPFHTIYFLVMETTKNYNSKK